MPAALTNFAMTWEQFIRQPSPDDVAAAVLWVRRHVAERRPAL
jgi:hypothetical protein